MKTVFRAGMAVVAALTPFSTSTVHAVNSANSQSAGKEHSRPNILYVFPDQFRNQAMNFWNKAPYKKAARTLTDPVHTPNIDKFADQSVVLSSAFSNCPLSSPHRGMMLTGLYPDGSGVMLNCNSNRPISTLNANAETISDVLAENGYDCGYIGKLHVDCPTKNNPQNPGNFVENRDPAWDAFTPLERRHHFRYWYSYGTYDVHKHPHYWDSNNERHEISEWSPKHEADKAISFIQNDRDKTKPFFLVVSMNPPHQPYSSLDDVQKEDLDLYKDIPMDKLLHRPNVNQELKAKKAMAPYYFAAVTGVDREFGRILQALKESGLDQNTIVVFTSDHGETMASHVEDPKNSPYLESFNVPFLIRYPDQLKPSVNNVMLGTTDIMPTLLSLAGLKHKIPVAVQGYDLAPVLRGSSTSGKYPDAQLYIQNVDGSKDADGKVISYFPLSRGVKTQKYTLSITIDRKKNLKSVLLFNDLKDPYQMHNLDYRTHARIFRMLTSKMAHLLEKADDPWFREKILSSEIPYLTKSK